MGCIILAFDFGKKSIGVAIGQHITGTATPLNALKAQDGIPNWYLVRLLLKEWQPKMVIVGLPLNMKGIELPITTYARKFANKIRLNFNIEVAMHDERLSTIEARSKLFEYGGFRALLNKGNIDSVSAVVILESYFENNCN